MGIEGCVSSPGILAHPMWLTSLCALLSDSLLHNALCLIYFTHTYKLLLVEYLDWVWGVLDMRWIFKPLECLQEALRLFHSSTKTSKAEITWLKTAHAMKPPLKLALANAFGIKKIYTTDQTPPSNQRFVDFN